MEIDGIKVRILRSHRDPAEMARRLKAHLLKQVERLAAMDTDTMLEARYRRLMSYGN